MKKKDKPVHAFSFIEEEQGYQNHQLLDSTFGNDYIGINLLFKFELKYQVLQTELKIMNDWKCDVRVEVNYLFLFIQVNFLFTKILVGDCVHVTASNYHVPDNSEFYQSHSLKYILVKINNETLV